VIGRRNFIKSMAVLGGAVALAPSLTFNAPERPHKLTRQELQAKMWREHRIKLERALYFR